MSMLLVAGSIAAPWATPLARRGDEQCHAIVFGEWSPPLHPGRATSVARPGRSAWATWDSSQGDSTLVLFPEWWPAGIAVRLDRGAEGELRAGRATAFVSDGTAVRPEAAVRAKRVPCGAPPPTEAPR